MKRFKASREKTEWIFEKFLKFYKPSDSEIVDWRPVTDFEIIVELLDGTCMRYNAHDECFGYLRNYETDESGNYTMNDDEYKQAFSRKLRRVLCTSMMSQTRLSELTGISQVSISHYLSGKSLPDCRNLTRIANVLQYPIDELMIFE